MNLCHKIIRFNIFIVSIISMVSCDPGYEEYIKITNNTDEELTFSLDFKKNIEFDTFSLFLSNRSLTSTRGVSPIDNSLIVNYIIPISGELFLHQDGGIGDVSFTNTDAGIDILTNHFDNVILENKILLKDLYQPENYTIITESKSTSSSSFMDFVLNVGDVE